MAMPRAVRRKSRGSSFPAFDDHRGLHSNGVAASTSHGVSEKSARPGSEAGALVPPPTV